MRSASPRHHLGEPRHSRLLATVVAAGVVLMCAMFFSAPSGSSPLDTAAPTTLGAAAPAANAHITNGPPTSQRDDGAMAMDDCGTLCPTGIGAACLLLMVVGAITVTWFLLRGRPRMLLKLSPRQLELRWPLTIVASAFRIPSRPWALCVMRN